MMIPCAPETIELPLPGLKSGQYAPIVDKEPIKTGVISKHKEEFSNHQETIEIGDDTYLSHAGSAIHYNIFSIPVAARVLYPATGFLLTPTIEGAAMVFSSISVVSNSLRLKMAKL